MARVLRLPIALVAALVLLFGCGDDGPTAPTMNSVAGEYRATTFTVALQGITVDVLALGGTLTLDLNENGTTTGRFFAPGFEEDGSDIDESLDGTWMLRGDTVTFSQTEDTLVRDLEFEVQGNRLVSEDTLPDGTQFRIVLTRQ